MMGNNQRRLACSLAVIVLGLMLGRAFAQGQARPRPSPAIGPAILVDSRGKQIGPYDWEPVAPASIPTGQTSLPTVLLKINGLWLRVNADYNGFGNHGGYLFYTTGDCTGTAYYAEFWGHPVVGTTFAAAGILHYADTRIAQGVSFLSYGTLDASTGLLTLKRK